MKLEEKITVLNELGLSINEAKIYLTLLEIGKSPVSLISKKSKMYRSNTYESLKKLISKGLVSSLELNGVHNYTASNPANLHQLLKEKENKLNQILPELELSNQMSKETRETSVIEGINGFMRSLYSLLEYDKEIVFYGFPKQAINILKTKLIHFHNERIEKKISFKIIFNSKLQLEKNEMNKKEFSEAKLSDSQFDSNVTTIVCGSKVLIMNWDENYSCITMKNEGIAESYKNYFKILWEKAE